MVTLATWTGTIIFVNGVPTRKSPLRNEISSIRHSDDESYGCENQCLAALPSSMSLSTVIPQGPFESNGRKQLSLHRVVGF